jgi:hypothetical protein
LLLKENRHETMLIEAKSFVVSDPHFDVARYDCVATSLSKSIEPWDIAFPDVVSVGQFGGIIRSLFKNKACN